MPAQAAVPFPVQTVTLQDAIVNQEYTANLERQQNVEIRSKVNGFIQKNLCCCGKRSKQSCPCYH
jgi:membrane fusion protein (multidrug efflux system)